MSGSAECNQYETAAAALTIRDVNRYDVKWKYPRSFVAVWEDMLREFPCTQGKALLSLEEAYTKLFAVMAKKDHVDEDEFNKTLFDELRECFGSYSFKNENAKPATPDPNDNFIVLDVEQHDGYAIGLARNVSVTNGLIPKNSNQTSAGLKEHCQMDQGSCLLRNMGTTAITWKATDVFSVVEVKTNKTSCEDFGSRNDAVNECDLEESKHGPLCQTLNYTLGGVLLYHARNGVLRDTNAANATGATTHQDQTTATQKTFPLAVIAGMLADGDFTKLRWVSGDMRFPNDCGDSFNYCVKSFGRFYPDNVDEERRSIALALSLYVDTLLFGLRAAKRVLRDRVGMPYQPDPMSGMKIMIGNQHLNFPILASPIPKPDHAVTNPANPAMVVSQAEFFCGNLDVEDTLTKEELDDDHLEFGDTGTEVPVLIKVSSVAVHHHLVPPDKAFSAIKDAKDVLSSPREGLDVDNQNTESHLVSGPLLAVVDKPLGLITIMADLSKQNYKILRPKEAFSLQLSLLWEGFQDLVLGVLLPLARRKVIHADIRPGYDFTANILVKRIAGGKVRMELVDYESLVSIIDWKVSANYAGYIQKPIHGWNAVTLVWWQCLFVAFAWLEERDLYRKALVDEAQKKIARLKVRGEVSDDVDERTGMADSKSLRAGIQGLKWLPASLRVFASRSRINENSVRLTLEELGEVFLKRDEYRRQMKKEPTLDALYSYLQAKEVPK